MANTHLFQTIHLSVYDYERGVVVGRRLERREGGGQSEFRYLNMVEVFSFILSDQTVVAFLYKQLRIHTLLEATIE